MKKIEWADVAKLRECYLELYRRMQEGEELPEDERYVVESLSWNGGEAAINRFFNDLELILW